MSKVWSKDGVDGLSVVSDNFCVFDSDGESVDVVEFIGNKDLRNEGTANIWRTKEHTDKAVKPFLKGCGDHVNNNTQKTMVRRNKDEVSLFFFLYNGELKYLNRLLITFSLHYFTFAHRCNVCV